MDPITRAPDRHHTYRAGGLTIAAGCPLFGVPQAPAALPDLIVIPQRPEWAVHPRKVHYTSANAMANGVPAMVVEQCDHGYAFEYVDGTEFWVDTTGTRIWMHVASTIEDACTYLIGPVLSFAFRLRGDFCLHSSAVATPGGAVAFVGPHGAGKSTTAAALGRRGRPVLADDILRLTRAGDTWHAHPFGGVIRLWDDAESLVFGEEGRLECLTPTWNKRGLPIGSGGVPASEHVLPLIGIAVLRSRAGDFAPLARRLAPAESAIALIGNSSASLLLGARERAVEFEHVRTLAGIECVEIVRSEADRSLDRFLDVIEEWMATLGRRQEVRV